MSGLSGESIVGVLRCGKAGWCSLTLSLTSMSDPCSNSKSTNASRPFHAAHWSNVLSCCNQSTSHEDKGVAYSRETLTPSTSFTTSLSPRMSLMAISSPLSLLFSISAFTAWYCKRACERGDEKKEWGPEQRRRITFASCCWRAT